MKNLTICLAFLAITVIAFFSCQKKGIEQSEEKQTLFTDIYANGGIAHNELLNKFANQLGKNGSKLSLKLKTIAQKYADLEVQKGTFVRKGASINEELTYDVNQAIADEVIPISISYLEDNGYFQNFQSVGIENSGFIINEIVSGIYSNPTFSNDQYVSGVISQNSTTFQNFFNDFKNLIESSSSGDLGSQIDALKNSYLGQISDDVEALAIINGCETAKESFAYWDNSTNTDYWDGFILNSFGKATSSSIPIVVRKDANVSGRGYNEIVASDAVGAIVGVIEGGRIGMLAGPGGAFAVGMAGMILRGAQASLGDYAKSKILNWLGW